MGGYWIDSPENPFNQMSWTRGGGGYDNEQTRESNDRRASAMQGAGASALPHFATVGVARALNPTGMSVVGDNVIAFQKQAPATSGAGSPSASTNGGNGGTGPGSAGAATPGVRTSGAGSRLVITSGPLKPALETDITEVMVGGPWLKPNPYFSDGQTWGDRYGEFGEWVGGAVVMAADLAHSALGVVSRVQRDGYQPLADVPPRASWMVAPSLPTLGFTPTPEAELPNPMSFRPASAW